MLCPWLLFPVVPVALAQRRLDGPVAVTTQRPGAVSGQGAAEVCFDACKAHGFCCNDYNLGSNQLISCAQACIMRFRGQTEEQMQQLCLESPGCVMRINEFEYGFCSKCLDLTDSTQCRWGVADASACQLGAQLKLCQGDLAGQVVTLFDVSRKAFLAIGEASSGSSYAYLQWVDDFSEAAAHWRMQPGGVSGLQWIFSSVYGPTNAPSSLNWRLSGCEMREVSDQILETNFFVLENRSAGVFQVSSSTCGWRMIIEAYPRNFSLCPEAQWAGNSISRSLRNKVLSGLLVVLACLGQIP